MMAQGRIGRPRMWMTRAPRLYRLPLLVLALSAVSAGAAWADMPMAPFFVFVKMAHWWVILLALAIETLALRYLFRMPWMRAAVAALGINVVSLIAGVALYPVAAVLGYGLLQNMIVDLFGTGDLVEISALWIGAAVVDTGVELLALRWMFAKRSTLGKAFGFLLANLASAGILVGIMVWQAQIPELSAEEAARVEAEYATEIGFLLRTLDAFPGHVAVPKPGEGFHLPDRDWTDTLLTELESLRIRTIGLSIPPATVWIKGSTALWKVDARFKDGNRTIDKGYFDTVLDGQYNRPTGQPHYRYRIEHRVGDTVYAIQAVLRP